MPANLLAICRINNILLLKRVVTALQVQNELEELFLLQEQQFLNGITAEIPFNGSWKPDEHEILTAPNLDETNELWIASQQNITALPIIDARNFREESIKGLAVVMGQGEQRRLLIQSFSPKQILSRGYALVLSGDTFTKINDASFTINSSIAAILKPNGIFFKSYSNARTIFNLSSIYAEATNIQINAFTGHRSLNVVDPAAIIELADQGIRKLINAIHSKSILDIYDVPQIKAAADLNSFELEIVGNQILIPLNRAELKKLLYFLDEGLYRGVLSGTSFITNSKRSLD